MYVSVFNEFASDEVLDRIRGSPFGITVDKSPTPMKQATTPEEINAVKTNAKLFFNPNEVENVDAVLAFLEDVGLAVAVRNPITSAGIPMKDRVILALKA
jgi:hypothetical protein